MSELDKFFNPKSVAIIGASHTPGKIGYAILESMKMSFNGKIYPINPNISEIMGLKTYSSVLDIEDQIDLAIIVVKSEIVASVLEECGKKKIRNVIIISSGFSEIGNKKGEDELLNIAKRYKIRIIGPNCIGIYKRNLDMLFMPREKLKRPLDGYLSLITQSGAFGSAILDFCAYNGIGVSKFISIGNRIDVNEIELLEYLNKDVQTRAIGIYLESTVDGKKFIETAKTVVKNKPIVIFKAGKTKKGTEAVASHTGALAGEYSLYQAAFKQAGIIEAKNVEQLIDFTNILAKQPPLQDNKIAIITDGGGFGIAAADAAINAGLSLPEPSPILSNKLKNILPPYASIKNPIDLTGDATSERYANTLDVILSSKEYSGVLIIALLQISTLDESIITVIEEAKKYGKPISVCMAGGAWTHERAVKLELSGIPVYPTPERAAEALAILIKNKLPLL